MTASATQIGELESVETLSSVLAEFEARILTTPLAPGDDVTEIVLLDRIGQPDALPRQAGHMAAAVTCEATDNTDALRDDVAAEVDEPIVVSLFYRVNPKAQKASRYKAIDLEERVRAHLTSRFAWHGEWCVNYRGATRGPHPASTEWWVSQQTFRIRRYARLGG